MNSCKTTKLDGDEKFEDLCCVEGGGYYIIQSKNAYRFTSDAVALANYAASRLKSAKRVIDVCSGGGVIALLLAAKTSAHITAVEINEKLSGMCARSVEANGLQNRIETVLSDILVYRANKPFDAVTVNPPYFKLDSGFKRNGYDGACAEVSIDLDGVLESCSRLCKFGGSVFMVHRADRLCELIKLSGKYSLELKEIKFLRGGSFVSKLVKGGKPGLKILNDFSEDDIALYRSDADWQSR